MVLHLLHGEVVWVQSLRQHCQKHVRRTTSNEFLAELCKAEKGVPKDKRNQRRTEIVTVSCG
jgi:hypothetical protein